jgi:flagellar motor component MotA
VLLAAIAICLLATLAGGVVLIRAALRLSRRLTAAEELATTARTLVARGLEARARGDRLRATTERLRSLAQPFI